MVEVKYVSCRLNFSDVDHFAPSNAAYYGPTAPEAAELLQVHGYNTKAENVEDAYRSNKEMARELDIQNPVAGYLWPGLGANWLESLRFHEAQRMADQSAEFLAQYLGARRLTDELPSVMTHSLGARVALEAILRHKIRIKTLVLLGAAVPNDCLAHEYAGIKDTVGKVLVFWSRRDDVLGRAFQLDQFKTALGHSGPAAPLSWVQGFDVSQDVYAHGDYRHVRSIWKATKENL